MGCLVFRIWWLAESTMLEIMEGTWAGGVTSDTVLAYEPSMFLLQQAVDSMAQAKALGTREEKQEEEEQSKRKESLILFRGRVDVRPLFIDGSKVTAGLAFANLARVIAIAGDLANAALEVAIYKAVKDPTSAIMNIMGMLCGVSNMGKAMRDAQWLSSELWQCLRRACRRARFMVTLPG